VDTAKVIFNLGDASYKNKKVLGSYEFDGDTIKVFCLAFDSGEILFVRITAGADGNEIVVDLITPLDSAREKLFRHAGQGCRRWFELEIFPKLTKSKTKHS